MQPSPGEQSPAGEYILPTSNSEYLTEETLISKGLTKNSWGWLEMKFLPDMEGCLIRQKYSSILIPDPGMFQSMRRQSLTQWEGCIFNEYEKYNMESIKALEDKLGWRCSLTAQPVDMPVVYSNLVKML